MSPSTHPTPTGATGTAFSPEPLYRQVAALLRGRITSGEFTGRLPSLKAIAQEYGVSHITAEKGRHKPTANSRFPVGVCDRASGYCRAETCVAYSVSSSNGTAILNG